MLSTMQKVTGHPLGCYNRQVSCVQNCSQVVSWVSVLWVIKSMEVVWECVTPVLLGGDVRKGNIGVSVAMSVKAERRMEDTLTEVGGVSSGSVEL
jgi:hypothetical protein